MFTIRQEQQSDYKEVYEVVKMAFATDSHSDGTEADYLNEVRTKNTFHRIKLNPIANETFNQEFFADNSQLHKFMRSRESNV